MVDRIRDLTEKVAAGKAIEAPPAGELVIKGSQLRRLLLGTKVTSAGIVIRGHGRVIIRGNSLPDASIDLSYLAGRDGGPLPPLILEGCRLEGKLRLTGSHFAFLSLDGCKFSRIDADHCQIDNHCRMINLRPIEASAPGAIAQIRMVAARIDGTADMRNSHLRAPAPEPKAKARGHADRYALSLGSAEIAGRLLLDEGFEALGGVSLYQATIRNSISVRTAKLESRHVGTPALDAQELRLAGAFLWANPAPVGKVGPGDWHVAGEVVLRHAEIGGDCTFEHCRWAGSGAESLLEGELVDHICGGIDLRFARVAGQLSICAGCQVAQGNAPPPRRKEEGLSGIFGPSLDGWKAQFSKGVRIECDASFAGPVLLNGADIGHELIFRGDIAIPIPKVSLPSIPEALDLSGAHIRGLARIWGVFTGCVRMHGAKVDGSVELQDLTFDCPPLISGDPAQDLKRGLATLLDLSAARISGALHIGNISLHSTPRQTSTERLRANVPGATVRAILPHPADPDRLAEFILSDGTSATVFRGRRGPELFEGRHDQFLELSPYTLPLKTPEDVGGFLDLYFRTAAGDLGFCRTAGIGTPKMQGSNWIVRGCQFIYGDHWYAADVCIDGKGEVWFDSDRPTGRCADPDPTDPERIGPFTDAGASRCPVAQDSFDPAWLADFDVAARAYFASRRERPLVIDLRGADCRSFNDMQGLAWNWLGPQRRWRLLLDGISFVQFEEIDPKSRSRREPARLSSRTLPKPVVVEPEPPREARRRRIKMLLAFVDADPIRGWRGIAVAAANPSYSPQPFQTFARAYTQSGNHFLAVEIVKVQRRLQWTRSAVDIQESIGRRWRRIVSRAAIHAVVLGLAAAAAMAWRGAGPVASFATGAATAVGLWTFFVGVALGWPRILIWVGRLFDFAYGFGLKPRRALVTAGLCLCVGIIVINATDSIRPVSRSAPSAEIGATRTQSAVEGCNVVTDSVIDRAIYAVDVFVPLVEFRQECAFTINERAWLLRLLKTLYAALGWLVVSLTLLTFSGVLRRDMQA
ncbi:MAG: hypothetical protein QOJ91_2000 [Sphingomonadales bacterium]|nr:hypothetical protein [Sphingomonadales bacterium]